MDVKQKLLDWLKTQPQEVRKWVACCVEARGCEFPFDSELNRKYFDIVDAIFALPAPDQPTEGEGHIGIDYGSPEGSFSVADQPTEGEQPKLLRCRNCGSETDSVTLEEGEWSCRHCRTEELVECEIKKYDWCYMFQPPSCGNCHLYSALSRTDYDSFYHPETGYHHLARTIPRNVDETWVVRLRKEGE